MNKEFQIAKLIAKDLDVAAHRLSDNLIFIRYLDAAQISRYQSAGKYPGRVIMTNNPYGEKHDPLSPQWNLYFEGKKHYVLTSFTVDEFTQATNEFKKINL